MKALLPVGSIVRLKNAVRKAAVMGYMQKVSSQDSDGMTNRENRDENAVVYDYMAVPYPEGFLGKGSVFLFNEEDIEEICFYGLDSRESRGYMELVGTVFDRAQKRTEGGSES